MVILGGGTAGWMAASALAKYFGDALAITLVESEAIGTIGVGEATIPQIRLFNSSLGIDERDFLRATGGTIKLGIEFVGWHREGARYFHGFGDVGRTIGLVPFHHYWLRYRAEGGDLPLDHFIPTTRAAREGRYGPAPGGMGARLPASAYHFDAARYAAFLRDYAEARGVTRQEGILRRALRDGESGHLTALELQGGRQVEGDLFLDCSGMRALLIEGEMQSGFEDWSHWLPCDRAIAIPSEGDGQLNPFTRATARAAGWQWEIPLRHRTGNGHVYSSAHLSEEEALKTLLANLPGTPLDDPRTIPFRTGKRREIWKGNCLAIGLSSGFLEPLESTSIHLIQSAIARLIALFPDRRHAPDLAAEFNRQSDLEYASIRDFLILHYHLTAREGSEFWRECRAMTVPDSLTAKMELFRRTGRFIRGEGDLFDTPNWVQVMWGQGISPGGFHPMVRAASAPDLAQFIARTAAETDAQVATLGPHADWITRLAGDGG
ncbi:tryptophan halogenase family protein [Pseudooceanicola sp.]|uniref:tryptophan halogenase family protein n=1 Tax=Pseudooceanicola sp. TaxID=1914328 RepID=UPI0035C77157